jgi:hypothetical protein
VNGPEQLAGQPSAPPSDLRPSLDEQDAQSQGCSEIYHLAHAGMLDNQAALVAYTRLTDGKYTMYADSATMESLGDRPGMDRLKENATKSDRKTLTKAQSIRVQTVTPVVQEKPKVQEVQREQPEVEQKVRVQSQRR